MRDMRPERTHRERNHVESTATHAAVEKSVHRATHFRRRNPIVCRTRIVLLFTTDKCSFLDPRDVCRVRQCKIAIRPQRWIQPLHHPALDHLSAKTIIFGLTAITPNNTLRPCQRRDLRYPFLKALVTHIYRCRQIKGLGGTGLVHGSSLLWNVQSV